MSKYEGRVWQSKTILLGRPFIDINVSDPASGLDLPTCAVPKIARGWIAIGDRANGILLSVGGRACGLVAVGGVSIGVISIGGMAAGLISCGGLAVGLVSIGGLGLGGFAIGGLAIGYQAVGGLALAWDFACGGGAASFHWAYGGGAWARDAAIGGAAKAPLVNTPELRQMMEAHWMVRAMNWQIAHKSAHIYSNDGDFHSPVDFDGTFDVQKETQQRPMIVEFLGIIGQSLLISTTLRLPA